MVKIAVIGNMNVDLIALFDELPGLDEGRETSDWKALPGGSGSNFSVAAKTLGASVTLYTAVGTGHFSKLIKEELERLGIRIHGIRKEGEQSLIFIASTPKGKVMYSLKGASHKLLPEDLPDTLNGDVIHVASKPSNFVFKYSGKGRLSYSPGPHVFQTELEMMLESIKKSDIVFLNESEARHLNMYPHPIVMPKELLVVTLGEKGSVVFLRDSAYYVEPFKVDTVVDTTGAGDVYAAAFLTEYLRSKDPLRAAKVASVAGAIAVTVMGGFVMLDSQVVYEAARQVRAMKWSPTPER